MNEMLMQLLVSSLAIALWLGMVGLIVWALWRVLDARFRKKPVQNSMHG